MAKIAGNFCVDPSPDWIVGVSGLELCLLNCTWIEHKELNLYPYDVGTDDGITYMVNIKNRISNTCQVFKYHVNMKNSNNSVVIEYPVIRMLTSPISKVQRC